MKTKQDRINHYLKILDEDLFINLRKSTRTVTKFYDNYLKATGIRATQLNVLIAILIINGGNLTQIANELSMDRTTLARNTRPLEKDGIIKIEKLSDRRFKRCSLTEKGIIIFDKSIIMFEEAKKQIEEKIEKDLYRQLNSYLKCIEETIKDLTY
jgi:DNA-binding MarR family transcriptional regulator